MKIILSILSISFFLCQIIPSNLCSDINSSDYKSFLDKDSKKKKKDGNKWREFIVRDNKRCQ